DFNRRLRDQLARRLSLVFPRDGAPAAARARRPHARPDRAAGRALRPGRREASVNPFGARRILWRVLLLAAVPLLVVFLPKAFNDYFNYRLAFVGIYFFAIVGANVPPRSHGQTLAGP